MIYLFLNGCIVYLIPCCSEFPCYRKSLNELVTFYIPKNTLEKTATPVRLEKSCAFQRENKKAAKIHKKDKQNQNQKTNEQTKSNKNLFPLLFFLYVAKKGDKFSIYLVYLRITSDLLYNILKSPHCLL